jgi:hypothetical protein
MQHTHNTYTHLHNNTHHIIIYNTQHILGYGYVEMKLKN